MHPGGPFWANKDERAWSIPKGEVEPGEDPAAAARREWAEELGVAAPEGELVDLGEIAQSRKRVHAFAVAHDLDPASCAFGEIEIDWPPRSGRRLTVPEVDRAEWTDLDLARRRLHAGQVELIDRLEAVVGT